MSSKLKTFFKNRFSNLFFGLFFTAFGIHIMLGESDYYDHWGYPVSRLTWIFNVFLGLFFLLMAALRRSGPCEQVILICPKCKVF